MTRHLTVVPEKTLSHNLNECRVPPDADAATAWAIREEYALRSARYRIARRGILGAVRTLNIALRGLDYEEAT